MTLPQIIPVVLAGQFSQERAGTLHRSRPPQSRGRSRRSVSTAQDRRALGLVAAWWSAFALFSCSRPMSRSIGQSLADNASQRPVGALYVVNTKSDPLVVAEVELGQIPFQMFFAYVMIHADDAALEDREITLNRVCMSVAANIFLRGMIDSQMARKAFACAPIDTAFISPKVRLWRNLLNQNGFEVRAGHIRDMEGGNTTLTLDQRNNRFLAGRLFVRTVLRLTANIGFVGFNKLSFAAHTFRQFALPHCLTNAMAHEPRGFEGYAEGPVKLVATDSLFGRAQQEHRLKPNMQLNMAGLEDGSHLNRKGLAAGVALVDADPGALACKRTVELTPSNRTRNGLGKDVLPG